jgi:hypothetical protein
LHFIPQNGFLRISQGNSLMKTWFCGRRGVMRQSAKKTVLMTKTGFPEPLAFFGKNDDNARLFSAFVYRERF